MTDATTARRPVTDVGEAFLRLHTAGRPLLLPNPWDAGSARLLEALGFAALATTSGGFAGTRGRVDGSVTRDEALAHAAEVVAAVTVPVSADLENGFADAPDAVAETVRLALHTGLAGCSVEDWDPRREKTYAPSLAVERVAAAAETAHGGPRRLVLTARTDAHLHGARDPEDLDATIARLQAFEAAGADVLYAPGVQSEAGIRRIVAAVSRPVNVLALATAPPVARLAELGVARVSTGAGLFWAAMGGLVTAATALRDEGTYAFWDTVGPAREAAASAFTRSHSVPSEKNTGE
ncbi:MAG: isocitrate lyase/phosphoenolpyruvate mutase family protein [Lapillicoccus sp.]